MENTVGLTKQEVENVYAHEVGVMDSIVYHHDGTPVEVLSELKNHVISLLKERMLLEEQDDMQKEDIERLNKRIEAASDTMNDYIMRNFSL